MFSRRLPYKFSILQTGFENKVNESGAAGKVRGLAGLLPLRFVGKLDCFTKLHFKDSLFKVLGFAHKISCRNSVRLGLVCGI